MWFQTRSGPSGERTTRALSLPNFHTLELFQNFTTASSATSAASSTLPSPGSEYGSSVWTGSATTSPVRHSHKSPSRDSDPSRDDRSRSKKSRRNRVVDINDIKIEFDPQKEFIWEMRKKYEKEKLRKRESKSLNDLSEPGLELTFAEEPNELVLSGYSSSTLSSERALDSGSESTANHVTVISISASDNQPEELDQAVSQGSGTPGHTLSPESTGEPAFQKRLRTITRSKRKTRYRRRGTFSDSTDTVMATVSDESSDEDLEVLVLHRLPGEKLGMGLSIESTGGDEDPVRGVFVDSVTPGGAADRATGGTTGLTVGDEILEVNGVPLTDVSYDETVTFFREMPLRVIFMVRRAQQANERHTEDQATSQDHSDSDDEPYLKSSNSIPEGFELLEISINKNLNQSLGLSIIPSYGSTNYMFQVSYRSLYGIY